jgi:hypothetical protein
LGILVMNEEDSDGQRSTNGSHLHFQSE